MELYRTWNIIGLTELFKILKFIYFLAAQHMGMEPVPPAVEAQILYHWSYQGSPYDREVKDKFSTGTWL